MFHLNTTNKSVLKKYCFCLADAQKEKGLILVVWHDDVFDFAGRGQQHSHKTLLCSCFQLVFFSFLLYTLSHPSLPPPSLWSVYCGSHLFSYSAPQLCNAPPQHLHTITSLPTFKSQVKTHILHFVFKSCIESCFMLLWWTSVLCSVICKMFERR